LKVHFEENCEKYRLAGDIKHFIEDRIHYSGEYTYDSNWTRIVDRQLCTFILKSFYTKIVGNIKLHGNVGEVTLNFWSVLLGYFGWDYQGDKYDTTPESTVRIIYNT
jgi:hypothetical protein